jgi:hypothetical protein
MLVFVNILIQNVFCIFVVRSYKIPTTLQESFELSRTVALTKIQETIIKSIGKEFLEKCSG